MGQIALIGQIELAYERQCYAMRCRFNSMWAKLKRKYENFSKWIYPHVEYIYGLWLDYVFDEDPIKTAEDLEAASEIRDWKKASIRFLALHPCSPFIYVALATRMDTVLLLHENELTCTQFKDHAKQRDITCMAFRSFTCFELAVGCAAGICLWSRNKDRYTLRMLTDKRHVYVTSLAWAENGLILISASLGSGNIIFWQPELGEKMRFLLGGRNGFSLLSYTPDPGFIFYAHSDAGASFCKYDGLKLFEGTNILSEKRIQSSAWTQCGSHLFFVEKDSSLLYACIAFPDEGVVLDPDVLWKPQVVADLDRVSCLGQHTACGHIQSIAIDPLDIYMAIIFKNQPFVLICFLALSQVLPVRILPRNYVTYNGNSTKKEEVYPTCVKFTVCQSKPVRSLVIVWSTGQLQRLVYNAQSSEEALSRMSTNSNLNQLKWTNYLTIGYGPESEMVVFK